MRNPIHIALLGFVMSLSTPLFAQFDYQFWMPPIWHNSFWQTNAPSELFITTSYPTLVNVHVETPNGTTFVFDGTVTSGAPLTIPLTAALGQTNVFNTVINNNGFIITSTAPVQCVHKVMAPINQTLVTLKGRNARGTDFWCGSQVRNGFPGGLQDRHFISVMAMEDNTQITFTTPWAMEMTGAGDLPNPHIITLNRHQCYLIRSVASNHHVTGAHVTSNKEIVVVSGSAHTPISGPGANASDGGTDQLVPVELAGTSFAVIRGNNLPQFDYAIIVGTQNNTNVYRNGGATPVANIDAGEFYDWSLTGGLGAAHSFQTDKPVFVYHVSGLSADDEVDMAIMPPLGCTGSRHIEFSKFTANVALQEMQLLVSPAAVPSLTVNGVFYQLVPGVIVNNIPGLPGWRAVTLPGTSLANHNIVHSDGFFHAGWLTGNLGATGAFGYLSGFNDAIEFSDPVSGLPTSIYQLGPLCQGQSIDHCLEVFSCAGDHEIVSYSGNNGAIVIAPPTAPHDSCFRYTAPFNFVGYDTVSFVVSNNFGAEGEVEVVFLVTNPNTPIDAGPNQTLCSGSSTTLSAVNPDPYANGYWTVAQGTGVITNPNSPTTTVTNLSGGPNSFIWHQEYPWCNDLNNVDIVQVFRFSGTPPLANAGPDASLCSGTNYTMQANNPNLLMYTGTGTWEIISGNATILNVNSPTAQVTNLAIGVNIFRWNISNGSCPGGETSDLMVINVFNQNHPASNAGADQSLCQTGVLTANLLGNTPQVPATGQWSVISGTGVFANANNPSTSVTGLSIGQNIFRWTINNGPCGTLTDNIIITVYSSTQPSANAGPDQTVCLPTNFVTLSGNTPVGPAVGTWTVISGTGSFSNVNSATTTVSGLSVGTNTFRWTINNGPCSNPITFDQVSILVYPASQPIANAGADQQFCFSGSPITATLSGSSFTAPGTVSWTVINGSGTFSNANISNPTVSGLSIGTNTFQYTVSNGPCQPATSDQIVITVFNSSIAAPNAGPDAQLCSPTTTYTMQATAITAPASGWWSLISGAGVISNASSPTTSITNLGVGINIFRWTINNGACGSSNFDEVSITVFSSVVPQANAGPDQQFCFSGAIPNVATMSANAAASPSSGQWTLVSGGGVITNATNPNTTITSLPIGTNIFQWTISNGSCGSTNDQMSIIVYSPAQSSANAGLDQSICSTTTSVNLTANNLINPATGQWTVVSGSGTFSNPNAPSTGVSGLSLGTNIFQWTINNGPCVNPLIVSDQVTVTVFNSSQASANAGPDQSICSTTFSVIMAANTSVLPAFGTWSVIAGSGTFANLNSPNSSVSGLSIGTNIFRWTISNGPCGAPTVDDVTVTVFDVNAPVANAGADQSFCLPQTSSTLSGNLPSFPSTGLWTVIAGTGTLSNATQFNTGVSGLSVGLNTFRWTINNGSCGSITFDEVSIFIFDSSQSLPNAGSDVSMCTPQSSYTMQANSAIFPAVGTWTLISGSGTIANVNSPTSGISGLGIGMNVFRWTITNGPCPGGFNFDEMTIFVFDENQPISNAGVDQSFCSNGVVPVVATMAASAAESPGVGTWTLIQGTGTIVSPNSPSTVINGLGVGENIFQWSVSNGACIPGLTTDHVSIFVYPSNQPTSNAGADQSLCSTSNSTILNANDPIFPGSGMWTVVQGSATFANASSPTTAVSNLSVGVNILQWTVTNGPCEPNQTSDQVSITVFDSTQGVANAGIDQSICSTQTSVTLTGNSLILPASSTWSLVSGSGMIATPNSTSTVVSGLAVGLNVFQYTINNGPCSLPTSDQIVVTVYSSAQANANAGSDQSLCLPINSTMVNANAPIFPSTGQWTLISGTGTISNPSSATTTFTNLGVGVNVFQWTINNGSCTPSVTADQMSIVVFDNTQPSANAGSDQSFCEPISSTTLTGNTPISPSTGQWTLISGTGTIVTSGSATTVVNGLSVGINTFRWTINNGSCTPSITFDEVSIFIYDDNQSASNAGADQILCSPTSTTTMSASSVIFPATGVWTLISGTGNIVNPSSPTTSITGLSIGINTFRWTISNGPCTGSVTFDEVSIFVYDTSAPAASSGLDLQICSPANSVTMSANTPVFPATGLWELVSGTGFILNPTSPVTVITNMGVGENVFRWTTNNGGCGLGTTSDLVTIQVYSQFSPNANAGTDQELCSPTDETTLSGNAPIFPGYGLWTLVSGSGTIVDPYDPNTQVIGLGMGPNVFEWGLFNGPCSNGLTTDQVTITVFNGVADSPDAGEDQELCSPQFTSTMTAVAAEFTGVGTWSVVSGTGFFADVNDPNSVISGLSIGVNVFAWNLDYSVCGSATDQVSIIVYDSSQGESEAGPDGDLCDLVAEINMQAQSVLSPGYGTWSLVWGSGTIDDVNDPNSLITNLSVGENIFVWTVYNGTCLSPDLTVDTVSLFVYNDDILPAYAGEDQLFCSPTSTATLSADAIIFPSLGLWELVSGTGTITNSTSNVTTVSGLSIGENIFRWSVNNGPCPDAVTFDEVSIFIFDQSQDPAYAGEEQSICTPQSSIVLDANEVIFPAVGTWTILSGTGMLGDIHDPNTTLSNLQVGETVLQWSISNGPCSEVSDAVVYIYLYDDNNPISNAGNDQELCSPETSSATLNGSDYIYPASGTWSLLEGSGNFDNANDPNTLVTGLTVGENIFVWTVGNGPCTNPFTTDTVSIFLYNSFASPAFAGFDQSLCTPETGTQLEAAIPSVPGYGTWAIVSGGGTISDINDPLSTITDLPVGETVLSWTIYNGPCSNSNTVDFVMITVFDGDQNPSFAGEDQELCTPQTSVVMNANEAPFPALGTWTLISGQGTILDANDPTTQIVDLGIGANVFQWSIFNGSCDPVLTTDQVIISVFTSDQPLADAGPDLEICLPENFVLLEGSPLEGVSTGMWTIIDGQGLFSNPTSNVTDVIGLGVGPNQLVWTVDNGSCGISSDTMSVFLFDPQAPEAFAGDDAFLCTPTSTYTMDALVPSSPGVGLWSLVSGTGTIVDPTSWNSAISGLSIGENVFSWTVYNGPCEAGTIDFVSIFVFDENQPPADAGDDQEICTPLTEVTMNGNSPIFPAVGIWTVVQGGGTIVSPTSPTTVITNLPVGINIFEWTISNGPCDNAITSDQVIIFVFPQSGALSNAGEDQEFCFPTTSTNLGATIPILPAIGTWSLVQGSGVIADINDPNSSVSGLTVGENVFMWTVYNGPCSNTNSTDLVSIFIFDNEQLDANAGLDQFLCTPLDIVQLSANPVIYPAIGTWTLISGSGIIEDPNNPTTIIDGLLPGLNVFQWSVDNGVCDAQPSTDQMTIYVYDGEQPDAFVGEDQAFCLPTNSYVLTGNSITGAAVGTWTIINGGGDISNINDANATVSNLPQGINTFVWSIDNGLCGFSSDTLTIQIYTDAVVSMAGEDMFFCTPASTHVMQANTPEVPGVGTWILLTGTAIIEEPNNPNSLITGLTVGENIFIWQIDNGPCSAPTFDVMSIFVYNEFTPEANAGEDQEICLPTTQVNMAASPAEFPAIGQWTLINGSGTVIDVNDPNTLITDLQFGTTTFVWTVSNGPCQNGITSDTVEIRVFDPGIPMPDAGEDQEICTPENSVVMNANSYSDPNYGFWSLLSGSAVIEDILDPQSQITGLAVGINVFTWTAYNGTCENPMMSDTVRVFVNDINQLDANSGPTQELCFPATSTTMFGNDLLIPAQGVWSLVSGSGIIADINDPNSTVEGLSIGTNTFSWTIDNGICDNAITTDMVDIIVFDPDPSVADAGEDMSICTPSNCVTMNAAIPSDPQTGTWTYLSAENGNGPIPFGSFDNVNDAHAQLCALSVGVHTLQWQLYNGPCNNITMDTVVVFVFDSSAATADSGPNQELCGGGNSTMLEANAAVFPALGSWTIVSAPGNPTISDLNDPTATISGLEIGVTTLEWTISNGSCGDATTSTVTISVFDPNSSDALAGEDQYFCENDPDVVMTASDPIFPAVGTWTIISGGGSITDINDPNTTITDVPLNENTYVWTIYNGACSNGITSDTVSVYVNDISIASANAGKDFKLCGSPDSLQLQGSVTLGLATGTWTILQGGGTIDNISNNNPYVFDIPLGSNVFEYTVDNGVCGITSDTVVVNIYDPNLSAADAGISLEFCANEFTAFNLMGSEVNLPALGWWSIAEGPIELSDTLAYDALVLTLGEIGTPLVDVPSMLIWTVDNGPCGITSDEVTFVLEDCLTLDIPDAFSPNGDGMNDTWTIPNIVNYSQNSLKIFNRWGAEVYSSAPYKNDWGGTSMHPATLGEGLPVSTYYFILDLGTGEEAITGFVYLKR